MGNKIHILNGPNLNLLGTREPDIYGSQTLQDIENLCQEKCDAHGLKLEFSQSNDEGALVDLIQASSNDASALIINAGAYTHTSIAIHDALKSLTIPIIEVHLSNIFARESFRHHSYISPLAKGVICGFGSQGYLMAIDAVAQ
jgi:3-dehydroquinate dehydratase II